MRKSSASQPSSGHNPGGTGNLRPLSLAQALWKAAYRVLSATGIIDLHVGRFSLRPLARYLVWHFFWPVCARLVPGPVSVHGNSKMYLSADPGVFQVLMGTYEQETCALFERFLKDGMAVVDAGANIGFYSLLAARKVGPQGSVYAFEPEAANYLLLRQNIELNGYKNIKTIRKAIADRTGRVSLYLSGVGTGEHSLYQDGVVGSRSVEVESVSFDDFWESEGRPPITFVKMDIQGAEAAALEGMKRFLESACELTMVLEFYPGGLEAAGVEPVAFLKRLSALGFEIQLIPEGKLVRLDSADLDSLIGGLGRLRGVNLLCTRGRRPRGEFSVERTGSEVESARVASPSYR